MNNADILSTWSLVADISPLPSPRVAHLQSPSGRFYLKESDSTEAVERHLDLLEYLASAQLPVPRYVPTATGHRYAVAEGRAFWLSRELPGRHFAQFHGPTGVAQVERLANSLSEVHRAFFQAPNAQRFPVFRDSAEDLLATLLTGASPFDLDKLQRLRGKIAAVATLPKQLIHRDFHRGNVLFVGEIVSGFLDFDLVHYGPRLFDVCYCSSSVLSESFREAGYVEYWLGVVEAIFRTYGRSGGLSTQERSLAWSMLMTIELIFLRGCLESQAIDAALMNQEMLFWFEDHRQEIEAAVAG